MCWNLDSKATLRTKGLVTGVMVSDMVLRAFGFGFEITEERLLVINNARMDKLYEDTEAATYLRGSPNKNPLKYPHL